MNKEYYMVLILPTLLIGTAIQIGLFSLIAEMTLWQNGIILFIILFGFFTLFSTAFMKK